MLAWKIIPATALLVLLLTHCPSAPKETNSGQSGKSGTGEPGSSQSTGRFAESCDQPRARRCSNHFGASAGQSCADLGGKISRERCACGDTVAVCQVTVGASVQLQMIYYPGARAEADCKERGGELLSPLDCRD